MFKTIYESPWMAAVVGVEPRTQGRRGPGSRTWELEELERLKRKEAEASIEAGTLLDAWAACSSTFDRGASPPTSDRRTCSAACSRR